jgi:hypothetical protein
MIHFLHYSFSDTVKTTEVMCHVATYPNVVSISLDDIFNKNYKLQLITNGFCIAYVDESKYLVLISDGYKHIPSTNTSYHIHYDKLKKYLRINNIKNIIT